MTNAIYMRLAIEQADENLVLKEGGPFGAVVTRNEEIICAAHNMVLANNDPTAHAEITAIRKACAILETYDLSDCVLYSSCYPCPMCLSAVIWANIKHIYYGNSAKDASRIGFRDDDIYKFIQAGKQGSKLLKIDQIEHERALKTFHNYLADSQRQPY
ncbi:Guanine deaminase [Oenococcus sicerae]|nr:Guanine deaminase [Oenococcus sicerae]